MRNLPVPNDIVVTSELRQRDIEKLAMPYGPKTRIDTNRAGQRYLILDRDIKYSATLEVADNADPNVMTTLLSVTSDEPDVGLGRRDRPGDIVIVDDTTFRLRAERSRRGDGRVYTISYQATDACGNSTNASTAVTVPR